MLFFKYRRRFTPLHQAVLFFNMFIIFRMIRLLIPTVFIRMYWHIMYFHRLLIFCNRLSVLSLLIFGLFLSKDS
jgi:hypothetical protein